MFDDNDEHIRTFAAAIVSALVQKVGKEPTYPLDQMYILSVTILKNYIYSFFMIARIVLLWRKLGL